MSIAAVSWALSLPVPPSPKLTLVAIGQYADADGCCWPFIETLAADTSQSRATVKRRLKELEDADLLTRHARYKEDGGRTSDQLRLNLKKRADDIAAWIPAPDCTDPRAQIDPTPSSLVTPLNEPSFEEESSPPKPPQAETQQGSREEEGENIGKGQERLKRFREIYPNPSNKPDLVRQLLSALTAEEFERALHGARGVRARVNANPKRPLPTVSPEKFLRDPTLWDEWGRFAPKVPPPRHFEVIGTEAWNARCVIAGVLRSGPPRAARDERTGREGRFFDRPLPEHALGLAQFVDLPRDEWLFVAEGQPDYFAWRDFIRACGYSELKAENEKIECEFIELRLPGGRVIEAPKRQMGIKVPSSRPPAREGSTGPPQAAE